MTMGKHLVFRVCLVGFIFWASSADVFLTNLSDACLRCLCFVSTKCEISYECKVAYCGPYKISKLYWIDAGNVTLPDDDPIRNSAWEDCAMSFGCAQRIVKGYLEQFGRDCNDDGVTDCYDYMMINFNGGYGCKSPLNRTSAGRDWLSRYEDCKNSL